MSIMELKIKKQLNNILKSNCYLQHFKTKSTLINRLFRYINFDSQSLPAITRLVITDNNKKYKLITANSGNQYRINILLYVWNVVSTLNFVPKLIWHNDNNLLFEYIEGKNPDIKSKSFAYNFGENLAQIHKLDK